MHAEPGAPRSRWFPPVVIVVCAGLVACAGPRQASSVRGDVALPAVGAFYYPWFPETWTVGGAHVSYEPVLGYYDSSNPSVVDAHIQALEGAGIDVAIASWWGPGTHDEDTRIPLLLDHTIGRSAALRWALYYEIEGTQDPSSAHIASDLAYIVANCAQHAAYARVEGHPVLFVYNADDATCEVVDRWRQAAAGNWYIVLKVFPDFELCPEQPDAWHQYSPAVARSHQPGFSFSISPGFWRADEDTPRLVRDLDRWERDVRAMVASGEPWQLVTTFNEWGEGTATEAATEWATANYGSYLDALAEAAAPLPNDEPVHFAMAGDIGGKEDRGGVVLEHAFESGAQFFVVPGDLSYGEIVPESEWCAWVFDHFPAPFQIVTGNHEDDDRVDGFIRDFAACLPDRMDSSLGPGGYGVNYFFDRGAVRVIAMSADLSVDGVAYEFAPGSPERSWLLAAIRGAPAWTIVTTHKPCLSIGNKSCEIGDDLMDLFHDEGVDLAVYGHDHDYQRSHALLCADPAVSLPGCIADDGSDNAYVRGSGTVHVVVGSVGRSPTTCDHTDPDAVYFATHRCAEESDMPQGYLLIEATNERLDATYVGVLDGFRDAFRIEMPETTGSSFAR